MASCRVMQVRQVAAVTLQRGFFRLRQRAALLRTRFAVLRVQSSGLAMLLRRWERRFSRFLTIEQARLVAGYQDVMARRGRVRGNIEERQVLIEVRPPVVTRPCCPNTALPTPSLLPSGATLAAWCMVAHSSHTHEDHVIL